LEYFSNSLSYFDNHLKGTFFIAKDAGIYYKRWNKKPQKGGAQMAFYAGIDLHSRNNYLGILDGNLKRVFKKKMANDLELIIDTLEPFRSDLSGIVVESTYNWYWLVDGLMDTGYSFVHLANPSAIKKNEARYERQISC
jgi:hypothetical protein